MKFSVFFEAQISQPDRAAEARTFHECVEQAVLADELGYHGVWAVEHHGLYEYAHMSAPEVFLAFVAARTKRIRIGHGVTLLPYRYNHPIRVAERVATLDILSQGRLDWGTGKSSSLVEQLAFESERATLDAQWLEAIEIIPRMWSEDVFSHSGRFFKIPPTQIVPKPIQRPHPPMFGACTKPETAARMGRLGLGALNFAFGSDDLLASKVAEYRRAVEEANPEGRAKTNHFACTPGTLVLDDDRKACEVGFRGARFFLAGLSRYYLGNDRPTGELDIPRGPLLPHELDAAMRIRNAPGSPIAAIVGDPACARETVARFREIGVDELILVMQLGTVPHELIVRSMRTFAEKVMPHFG